MTGSPVSVGELVGVDYLNEVARAHWRDTTLVDIVSSVTETDLIGVAGTGVSIPANTLGSQRKLRISIIADLLNNVLNGDGPTFKIYYGGTSVACEALIASAANANRKPILAQFEVAAEGVTNAQAVWGIAQLFHTGISSDPSYAVMPSLNTTKAWTDLAIDSTVAQNLRVTATLNANSASLEFRKRLVIVEVV